MDIDMVRVYTIFSYIGMKKVEVHGENIKQTLVLYQSKFKMWQYKHIPMGRLFIQPLNCEFKIEKWRFP